MWDKFLSAFSNGGLSVAVNRLPYQPSLLRRYASVHYTSELDVKIGLTEGRLTLIEDTPRGVTGTASVDRRDSVVALRACHLSQPGRITPDDVRNRLRLGSESLPTLAEAYLDKLARKRANIEATLEYHLLGAIRGLVLDAGGSVLYDLYEAFGQESKPEVKITIPTDDSGENALQKAFQGVVRDISNTLGGVPVQGVVAIAGDNFWDGLINNPRVEKQYALWAAIHEQNFGGNNFLGSPFTYGGISFLANSLTVGGNTLVEPDKAYVFPLVEGGLQQWFSPSDFVADLEGEGLDFYAHQWISEDGKNLFFEVQSNPTTFFAYPEALRTLTINGGD